MKQFEVKTEVELIRLFRLNIAAMRKDSLKDKLRGLLFNTAFMKFVGEKKKAGLGLQFKDIEPFFGKGKLEEAKGDRISEQ